MKPGERVHAALQHRPVDRPPRFEVWIDALLAELGQPDTATAHANLGQDAIMLPSRPSPDSKAWGTGVDEWGRAYGQRLALIGNIDVNVRFGEDLVVVRREVDRCLIQGRVAGNGHLISPCNRIFAGMNPAAGAEMFRYLQAR